LVDSQLNVHFPTCLKWKRIVEMFQWREVWSRESGKYVYVPDWSAEKIDSKRFKLSGFENPPFPLNHGHGGVHKAQFGAFTIGPNLLCQMEWYKPQLVNFS